MDTAMSVPASTRQHQGIGHPPAWPGRGPRYRHTTQMQLGAGIQAVDNGLSPGKYWPRVMSFSAIQTAPPSSEGACSSSSSAKGAENVISAGSFFPSPGSRTPSWRGLCWEGSVCFRSKAASTASRACSTVYTEAGRRPRPMARSRCEHPGHGGHAQPHVLQLLRRGQNTSPGRAGEGNASRW